MTDSLTDTYVALHIDQTTNSLYPSVVYNKLYNHYMIDITVLKLVGDREISA